VRLAVVVSTGPRFNPRLRVGGDTAGSVYLRYDQVSIRASAWEAT